MRLPFRRKTYMLFSEHGNALGSWTSKEEALAVLDEIITEFPEYTHLLGLLEFNRRGMPTKRLHPPVEEA